MYFDETVYLNQNRVTLWYRLCVKRVVSRSQVTEAILLRKALSRYCRVLTHRGLLWPEVHWGHPHFRLTWISFTTGFMSACIASLATKQVKPIFLLLLTSFNLIHCQPYQSKFSWQIFNFTNNEKQGNWKKCDNVCLFNIISHNT